MTETPLLSICIPTYNRAKWLKASLQEWAPQVHEARGLVELLVCDNCSTDDTPAVAHAAADGVQIRYSRNDSNLGAIGNIDRLVRELARGEYVWVVGDDDTIRENALQTVIAALQSNSDINYFHLNYYSWAPREPEEILQLSTIQESDLTLSRSDQESRRLPKTAELIAGSIHCFTPMYSSIIRRKLYQNVFAEGARRPVFTSLSSTVPHAEFIVSELLTQPAYYLGRPSIVASEGVSWESFAPIYVLRWLPALYDLSEKHGADQATLNRYRRTLLIGSQERLWNILFDPKAKGRDQFSLGTFVKRNARFPEFRGLLRALLLKMAYAATPAPARTLWKRIKKTETQSAPTA